MKPISQQIVWSTADLDGWEVPQETKEFLMTKGLPQRIGESTIEFGVYGERHIIGYDYDYPILVSADGTVWHQSDDGEPVFMNSSVIHLARFIEFSDSFDAAYLDDDGCDIGAEIDRWLRLLTATDPAAFAHPGAIWPQIVDDARMTLD